MDTQTIRTFVQQGSAFSLAAYDKGTIPPGFVPLPDSDLARIDKTDSGYQARVYVSTDPNNKQIFIANTGTNDWKDVAGWSSAYLGAQSAQFQDALTTGKAINALVQLGGQYEGYTVITTGHSWGKLIAQMQAYTFGWKGVGFDGPGAQFVVSDTRYTQMASDLGIAPVGKADFISCNTSGWGFFGGGVISSFGADIAGTTQCTVDLPGSIPSGLFNAALTFAGSSNPIVLVSRFALGKLVSGVGLHDMEGINNTVQSGNFSVDTTTPTPTQVKPFSYQDDSGNKICTVQDTQGNVILDKDGSPLCQITLNEGSGQVRTIDLTSAGAMQDQALLIYNADGSIYQRQDTTPNGDGSFTTITSDGSGALLSRSTTQTLGNGNIVTATTSDGTITTVTTDPAGNIVSTEVTHATTTLDPNASDLQKLSALLNVLQAIKSGKPLPIASAGINLVSVFDKNNLSLTSAGAVLGSVSSLLALEKNLQNHDLFGTLNAGAQLIQYSATAYAALGLASKDGAGLTLEKALATGAFGNSTGFIASVNDLVPGINIVYHLASGDVTGAVLAVFAINFPPAIFLAPFLVDTPKHQTGIGRFVWNYGANDVGLHIESNGIGAGSVLGDFLGQNLQPLLAQAAKDNPQNPLGLVAYRLPGIDYLDGVFYLDNIRNLDGSPNNAARRYDSQGNRLDAVGSDGYFRPLGQQLIYDALRYDAIAPLWEVQTARMQYQNNPPDLSGGIYAFDFGLPRGHTEVGYSGAAPANAPASFKPILLDLNGDGQIATLGKQSVVFDVDDTGFLRNTDWAGPQDGILVLDKNANGKIDGGNELFSNSQVPDNMRGLPSLYSIDGDLNGVIDSKDPVFNYLQVWQDSDGKGGLGNGVVNPGELKSLSSLGIKELHYAPSWWFGTPQPSYFVRQDGSASPMSSNALAVDAIGSVQTPVKDAGNNILKDAQGNPLGLYVAYSDGKMALIPLELQTDSTTGHKTVAGGKEDLEIDISLSLLQNNAQDTLTLGSAQGGSIAFRNNSVTATTPTRQGVLVFTPTADYNGKASFTYTHGDGSTSSVDIPLAAVNDAPVITDVKHTSGKIYGYEKRENIGGNLKLWMPIFNDKSKGYDQNGVFHSTFNQALKDSQDHDLTGVDPYSGKFQVQDADGETAFSYNPTGQGHYGTVAVANDGSWKFKPDGWVSGQDAFRVEVLDHKNGATATKVVTVPLPAGEPAMLEKILAFTPGPDGRPVPDYKQYRGHIIQNMSSADIGDIADDEKRYDYGWDGNTLTITDPVGAMSIIYPEGPRMSETLVIDPIAKTITDTFKSSVGEIVTTTYLETGMQHSDWWLVSGRSGSENYDTTAGLTTGAIASLPDSTGGTKGPEITLLPPTTTPTPGPVPTPTPAPTPNVAPPTPTPPETPQVVQAVFDAADSFQKNNTEISFRIDPDGTTHLTYTTLDGTANSFEAGPGGSYTVSQTPKYGVPTYLTNDPANSYGGEGVGFVLPQQTQSIVTGTTTYDFGGGVTVAQNPDGTNQYQVPLPGGGSATIQVDGNGTHFKVYDTGGSLVGQASTRYDASGNFVYTPEPLPAPPVVNSGGSVYTPPSDGGSAPSSSGSGSSASTATPSAYNGGSTSFSAAEQQAIQAFFASNPTPEQIAAAAAAIGLTTDQTAAAYNIGTGANISGGNVTDYIDTNLSGQYTVGAGGVIVGGTPIVLDLDGDGVSLVPLALSTAAFDIAGTGERLKTGWAAPGDALLAFDADGNGAIDHFNEISFTGYVPGAATDLEGLAAFDTNHDGKLTAEDALWSKLRLWQDKNQNGVSDAGELSTLADLGITAIGLDSDHQVQVRDGNVIYGTTRFTRTDGSTGLVGDVRFDYALPGRFASGTDGNDVLTGGEGNDQISGGAGNDVLIGLGGDDLLDGGTGIDAMFGGAGNDTYVVDDAGDRVLEKPDEGVDTVRASVSYTLAANVEVLELTGSANIDATGNDLANRLVGNDGANTLTGGGGNDTLIAGKGIARMVGGTGDDTYLVNNAADVVIENAGEGIDQVLASVNTTLADNVENLILTGSATQGTGNDLANIITGNNLGGRLEGGAGDDLDNVITGNAGNNVLDGVIDQNDHVFDHLWVWQDNLRRKEAADEYLYFCERMAA